MVSLGSLARKVFGSANDRRVKSTRPRVEAINAMENEMRALSDADLVARTQKFRDDLANGASLDDLLVPAFATVREAARRVLGMRPFDVQLVGGMVLHNGGIAEMRTGEGKTLVATAPVYLNALAGKGVHVVTVNDYLASRDAEWMGRIYKFLGMSVGIIVHGLDDEERRAAYACDITYATNNELGFDYLRDNMKYERAQMVQRGHNYAIVDEVDSILIDEARTPLIISGPLEDRSEMYNTVDAFIVQLLPEDYEVDEKQKTAIFTEDGTEKVENMLRGAGLLKGESLYDVENVAMVHHVNNALKAHRLFQKDKDYIVRNGEIVIIDEFTGRMMPGRRYSEGLHQALEAKEHVAIQPENQTLASVTFQNYFRMYKKLAGMTGTALTEAEEFGNIYGLEVTDIPTNLPVQRIDEDDEVYRTVEEKYRAIIQEIRDTHAKGQPVLVGTTSIEKSELLAELLKKEGIKGFQVLNARHHEQEASIVAQAGVPGAITIATNMAGRGTDIQLGGNADMRIEQELADMPAGPEREAREKAIREDVAKLKEKALAAGGLYVLATERHESRRIDNQLRGRSGRQGDPGRSKFYLSLQDDLMRIFGSERMDGMLTKLGLKENEAIIHPWINKALEKAQTKVEARNFDIRKQLLEYDDVSNDQRKVIYQQRNDILEAESLVAQIASLRESTLTDVVRTFVPAESLEEQWDLPGLEQVLQGEWQIGLSLTELVRKSDSINDEEIVAAVAKAGDELFQGKLDRVGIEQFNPFMRMVLLQSIDQRWREHLAALDYLRQGIHLRGYAQKNPKQEYKREAFELFSQLLDLVKMEVTRTLLNVRIQSQEEADRAAEAIERRAEAVSNVTYQHPNEDGSVSQDLDPATIAERFGHVGRNDPCPCGSGKKFKLCHGKLA